MTGPIDILGDDTPQPPDWAYRAPKRADGYPDQCYYRAGRSHRIDAGLAEYPDTKLTLFRFDTDCSADLKLVIPAASVQATLSVPELTALRDALNDALADIAAWEADRERRESFDRIQEELLAADEYGSPCCYICHPDVHYVPADQVQAKAAELHAAGAQRYIVLPHPPMDAAP
jgi:hypothetical protein